MTKLLKICCKYRLKLNFYNFSFGFFKTFKYFNKNTAAGLKKLNVIKPDFIVANDLLAGVLAYEYKKISGINYWYDSHELQPFRNQKNSLVRSLITFSYEQKVIDHSRKTSVVNIPISSLYKYLYGRKAIVSVNNFFKNHKVFKVNNERKKALTYFGHLNSGRGLKYWDKIAELLNIDLILVFSNTRNKYEEIKLVKTKIIFARPFDSIEDFDQHYMNEYKLFGLCLIEPVCLSYKLALPNKYFEYKYLGLPSIVLSETYLSSYILEQDFGYIYHPEKNSLISIQDK